jgi:hypothetical protein
MIESTNAMADEYKVGTRGRLIYLHFGQETGEEKAERQALMLRVADSLGVAVLPPHDVDNLSPHEHAPTNTPLAS